MNTDLLQQDRLGRSGTNANARGAAGSSWTAWLRKQREAWTDTARQDLVAEAYRPVLHRFLLVTTVYYLFVTWVYLSEEAGIERVALLSVSLPTALAHGLFHSALAPGRQRSLRQVEAIALVTNLLMYVNTLSMFRGIFTRKTSSILFCVRSFSPPQGSRCEQRS